MSEINKREGLASFGQILEKVKHYGRKIIRLVLGRKERSRDIYDDVGDEFKERAESCDNAESILQEMQAAFQRIVEQLIDSGGQLDQNSVTLMFYQIFYQRIKDLYVAGKIKIEDFNEGSPVSRSVTIDLSHDKYETYLQIEVDNDGSPKLTT